ncbi:LptF/LptG family permease [Luteolibacter pohnpeiensis]|uniref:LptF/LptG family permease n=1 Tax=Luteolibacter pohnpeiensis TaxID=454153 RepID=A0A934VY16_9BACT|nr:LptF/LptG family permease [Luteolibacter pohnpeiensis]MBK1884074.1 LptF/LptG family permease [Luteolibacter pohnpeiensis]
MRISDRYIGKQVLLGTLYAIVILSLVLVLGNIFQKIRELLVDQVAPLGLIVRFILSVLPTSLIYTIPWGFLSAVLLVFGRLSSDREIVGFRVAGMSLFRLAVPVFVIGGMLSLASLWLNINVVPAGKSSVRELVERELYEQAIRDPKSLLKPGVVKIFKDNDDKRQILIQSKSKDGVNGFNLYQFDSQTGARTNYIYARYAAIAINKDKGQMRLKLQDTYFEDVGDEGQFENALAENAEPLMIDVDKPRIRKDRTSAMTNQQISQFLSDNPDLKRKKVIEARAEITKRYSFSMACLAFAFIAVPLGINSRRKDTSSGMIMSILLGAGYFLFSVLASEAKSSMSSTVILWAPNVICVLLGLFLFRRARFR